MKNVVVTSAVQVFQWLMVCLSAAALAACTRGPGAAPHTVGPGGTGGASAPRLDLNINDGWRFERADSADAAALASAATWASIALPHTWNNLDGQDGGDYYRGIGWYRRQLPLPAEYAGRRIYLQFDGAFLVTDVYVNGIHVGQHRGGFAAFRFDITSAIKIGADNVVAVKVSNAPNPDVPPLQGDFTFFGGLYRDAHLVVVDPLHIDLEDYGSSGVFLTPSAVSAASATLRVQVKLRNSDVVARNFDVQVDVKGHDGTSVTRASAPRSTAAGTTDVVNLSMAVTSPHLWNGVLDPYLYRVEVTLAERGRVVDAVTQPLGLRSFAVDAAAGFSLNGAYLAVRGVNRHQDHFDKGWAISAADQDQDLALIRELGANAVRLAHYQHSQYFHDLCDKNGLVVWAELAMINQISNSLAHTANARQQLTELIRQNYNHPSIFVWGLENEVIDNIVDPNPLIAELNALAHVEDPSRLTSVAANLGDDNPINWHSDLVGFNKYYGWYYGQLADIAGWADAVHAAYPLRKIAVSEYGAGAGFKNHALPSPILPQAGHSEEYQALFHETYWKALASRRFLWGAFVWQMFDSASDGRNELASGADALGINDKGLVSFDRATKKDAFYWYKANWSVDPFVYITSRRFTQRATSITSIKVYSNLASVELKLNGSSLGAKPSADHVFVWHDVTLATGANRVEAYASAGTQRLIDSVVWTLDPREEPP